MSESRWRARPLAAGTLKVLIVAAPAVAGGLAAWGMGRALPEPSGFGGTAVWFAALVGVAMAVVLVTQRAMLRLLPLAWLFTLTLAFPDRAPSRIVTARRAASRRQRHKALGRLAREGLGKDPGAAAGSALVLIAALGAHDRRTRGHSERVRTLADLLAEEAGVPEEDRDRLRWGALLHDIGKLSVPGAILNKPARPDPDEWETLKRHPAEGAHLVEPLVAWLGPWAGAVGHHHEKWDGTGYPQGLAGEEISFGGRILAVADSYEVMTAARAYKKPMSAAAAREELVASAGTHFDPTLVRAFMGISLGALWWTAGLASALAQLPLLSRLGTAAPLARIRSGLAGGATAVVTVTALVAAGAVGGGEPAAARRQAAAPAPAAESPPVAPPAEPAAAPVAAEAVVPNALPGPSPRQPEVTTAPPASPSGPAATGPTGPVGPPSPGPSSPPPAGPTPPSRGPGPGPSQTAAAPPYIASGRLLAPDVLGRLGLGLTGRDRSGGCGPSASQGTDALVFELPPSAPGAGAPVKVTGNDLLGLHNLAVRFLGADCAAVGQLDTPAADEAGLLPVGTRYVIVTDRLGLGTTATLTVG